MTDDQIEFAQRMARVHHRERLFSELASERVRQHQAKMTRPTTTNQHFAPEAPKVPTPSEDAVLSMAHALVQRLHAKDRLGGGSGEPG